MDDVNVCIISLVIIVFVLFIIRIISLSLRNIILLRQLKHEEVNGTNFTTPKPFNWALQNPPTQPTTNSPWQLTTFPPQGPGIIITDGYWYWSSFYYFYVFLILIICIGVIAGALARKKRLTEQNRRARQHAQTVNSQGGNDVNNGYGLPPSSYPPNTDTTQASDCPPTYESAMRNYIDAKQQLRDIEENAMAGMTVAASTTTIETCISEVDLRTNASAENLSANNETINNINNVLPKPTQQQ